MKHNIILIGFMGAGKTTIGIKLSYRMKSPLIDTDRLIENEQGLEISEIFESKGEAYFRKLETGCLQELQRTARGQIIAVGGGLPVQEQNHPLLKALGWVVYLRVRPETVYERLKEDTTRPLLAGKDPEARIRQLLSERTPVYEAAADIIVDVDDREFQQILDEIEAAVEKRRKEYHSPE